MTDSVEAPNVKRVVCFTCTQQCGHIATFRDKEIHRLTGDREHPRTAGFICPKGAQALQLHKSSDRLHHPLKRRGRRGAGEWETISWDQALDEIAEKILRLAENHGSETVAYAFGTIRGADYAIGTRFMNMLGSPNSVGQDKICSGPTAMGEYLTYGFGPSLSALQANLTECFVLWGSRPMHSARPAWTRMENAIASGTKLIVIDPARTQEAERADLWLRPRPGTDAALGLGLLNEIIRTGRYDAGFVARETIGFDDLRAQVASYSLSRVAAISGVPAEAIRQAAHMMSGSGPTAFSGGNGLCQTGVVAVQHGRIIACLIAITGNLNRNGGNILGGPPRDLLANGDWMAHEALSRTQREKVLGADQFASLAGYERLDKAVSKAWYGKRGVADWLSTAHEPSLWKAILTGRPYPVRALVIQSHNPVGGSANSKEARNALMSEHLELLVAHDLFLNATSSIADYVLPAAHWLEKPYISMGGASLAWAGDYVEANYAALPPEHEHRSDYELFMGLGWRCRQKDHWPERAEDFYEQMLAPAGLTFASVAAHPGPLTGAAARNPDRTDPPQLCGYGTPSGMVELRSSLLEEWGQNPLPYFERSGLFDQAAEYPLVLVTGGRQIEGFHQNAQQTPAFRRKYPHPLVTLHPDLAQSLGVSEGQWVAIETAVGCVRQMVRIDDRHAPGVVHADRGGIPRDTKTRKTRSASWRPTSTCAPVTARRMSIPSWDRGCCAGCPAGSRREITARGAELRSAPPPRYCPVDRKRLFFDTLEAGGKSASFSGIVPGRVGDGGYLVG